MPFALVFSLPFFTPFSLVNLREVDPVATLSIMGNPELHCDPLLYSLVFGESVLNDAVAIVLFRVFLRYYGDGDSTGSEAMSSSNVPAAVVEFLTVSAGSVAVGASIGLLCSFLFKQSHIGDYPSYEIGLLFLFAYGSYAIAEAVELSGIMALFFCGIVLAHYNSYNLSEVSVGTAEVLFHSLAFISETFVFLYMGMGIFTGRFSGWSPAFIIWAIICCLVARIFNTFPISALANLNREVRIPMSMQFMIWFAGLRGAIAFALSQSMPGIHKDTYETTTLGVVIFTTVICGGLTEKVLTRTGMKRGENGYDSIPGDDPTKGASEPSSQEKGPEKGEPSGLHMWWRRTDARLFKPLFGGKTRDIDVREKNVLSFSYS